MLRVDTFLTGKAAAVWPGAVVHDEDRTFVLTYPEAAPWIARVVCLAGPPCPLPKRFATARTALYQLIEAEKRAKRG